MPKIKRDKRGFPSLAGHKPALFIKVDVFGSMIFGGNQHSTYFFDYHPFEPTRYRLESDEMVIVIETPQPELIDTENLRKMARQRQEEFIRHCEQADNEKDMPQVWKWEPVTGSDSEPKTGE